MFIKVIICLIFSTLFIGNANANWYIFSSDNIAVSTTNYEPSEQELAARGEFAVYSKSDIPLQDAEYINGKVKIRVKSQEEKNADKAKEDYKTKKQSDFVTAKEKLIALGLTSDEVDSLK